MNKQKKVKTQLQTEKPKQTLLFIKPKLQEELVPSPIAEAIAEPIQLKPSLTSIAQPPDEVETAIAEPKETLNEIQQEVPTSASIFQAVGVIAGTVRLDENNKIFVAVGNKEYPIYYVPNKKKRKAYEALIKEITTTGNHHQRLIVYPRISHFPKREQIHQVSFQLIAFESERTTGGLGRGLQDFEFKVCGLWQFIPVCQTPCITVLRNFTPERLNYIKKEDTSAVSKVKFMKASHVPVLWRDAPAKPFRFNPRIPKEEQGHSSFVEIKARFLPGRDVFGFEELLAPPSEKPPKFFKAKKEDKAEALKIQREIVAARK